MVQPIEGEPLRFFVASRRPGVEHYLVDLEEYNFNGWCPCEDFEFRMKPSLERGAAPAPTLRCWHIKQARRFFCETKMREVANR